MNENRDNLIGELHLTNPWVAAISQDRIEKALEGFPLPLADGWDYGSLTRAIQASAMPPVDDTPQSDAAAKKELHGLAKKASTLRSGIENLGNTAELAAFFDLLRRMEEERGQTQLDYQNDYLSRMVEPLVLIEHVLARAASQIGTKPPQRPRWTERFATEKRVAFAIALTPIFEDAFATPARSNNWKAEYGEEHAWPSFFKRIHRELYPEVTRLNLSEVLQDAARWLPHLQSFRTYLESEEATRDKES